jgi:hypothetical protein
MIELIELVELCLYIRELKKFNYRENIFIIF